MSDALENAKLKWKNAANYDQLSVGESTMVGVQSDGNMFVVNPDSGVSTASAVGGVIVTKTPLGPSYKVTDSVAVMRVSSGETDAIDAVDVAILEGHADAELQPLYAGAGVGVKLAGGSVSIFDFNLGAGLSTGIGIKDESINLKLAGTGVRVGKKVSISVFDNSFGIDFGRVGGALWSAKDGAYDAVKDVPGDLLDGAIDAGKEATKIPGAIADGAVDVGKEAAKIPGEAWKGVKDIGKELGKLNPFS